MAGSTNRSSRSRLLIALVWTHAAAQKAGTPAELSSMAICNSVGIKDLTPYMSVVPVTSAYGTSASVPIFLPVFSSWPLDAGQRNKGLRRVVVALHGLEANAQDYFCEAMARTAASPDAASTLVIAPWFGNQSVTGEWWAGLKDGSASLYWSVSRWTHGGNNSPGPNKSDPPVKFSTSFDALDAIVATVGALAAGGALPSVKIVTFAGFSAGAQLAQHYAFASHLAPAPPLPVRVLVSDPGSYLYLHPLRPAPQCMPRNNTGPTWTCTSFLTPSSSGCADTYDVWKYGVGGGLDDNLYILPLSTNPSELARYVAAYPTKDVRYVLGTADVCNCNTAGFSNEPGTCTPDPGVITCAPNADGPAGCCDTYPDSTTENVMDVSCEGMAQGSNRLQRGVLFTQYLQKAFSGFAPQVAFFAGGHNASAFMASDAFAQWALAA